ncbi:MAG: hypothetical protein CR975_06555 [Gammaproteobacteria bacterium]|nr:MAG: hypothetical protein CR975_06555 [Gammaproteobacteria bacterium]
MLIRLIMRLLRLLLLFVIVAVVALGLVLLKPIWVSSLIEQELYRHGVQADIQTLAAGFSGSTYQLKGKVSVKAARYGVQVEKANLLVSTDWLALLRGKPFMTQLTLGQAAIRLDRKQLMSELQQHKKASPQFIEAYLSFAPLDWRLFDTTLQTEGQTLSVDAWGQQSHLATLTLKDKTDGILYLRYQRPQHLLTVAGKRINLKALTGQTATLQQLQAVINTDNWLASRAEGLLDYRGMRSRIQLTGQGRQLLVRANSGGQSVSVVAQPLNDNQGVKLLFNQVDLAVFQTIQPLLPAQDEWPTLQGLVDGTVTAYRDKGVTAVKLTLEHVGVSHSAGKINHLSGDIGYADGIVRYQSQLNHSTLALPAVFPRSLADLNGSINGSFDVRAKVLTLQQVELNNAAVEKLTAKGVIDIAQQQLDITATADNVDIAHRRAFLPRQLSKEVRKWLGNALLAGKKNHSQLTMRGPWDKLFTNPDSVFLLTTQMEQTLFRYLHNNPDIMVQQGRLTIDKRRLTVDVSSGLIKDIPITGSASIADLAETVVQVKAGFKPQSLAKILPIAENSLAGDSIRNVKKLLTAKGKLAMDLTLNLPIGGRQAGSTFNLELSGQSITAALKAYPLLPVQQAKAKISVNAGGLQQVSLQGRYAQQPISITVRRDKAGNYRSQIETMANAPDLLEKLALLTAEQRKLLSRYRLIAGQSPYQAEINLDKRGQLQQVKVRSNLVGTRLNIFDLIQKSTATTLPLNLTYTANNRRLQANLYKRLDLQLSLNKKGQLAGLLLDNRKTGRRYQKGKIQLYWYGNRFNFAQLNNFRLAWQDVSKKSGGTTLPYRYRFDVDIKAMQVDDRQATYPLKIDGDLADLNVTSPFMTGTMYYQKNDLRANFSALDFSWLLDFFSKTEITPEGRKVEKISLAKALPQMQVGIERLIYAGNNIGNASVRTSIKGRHYSIDQLFIQGPLYFFEASGYESREPQGITTHLQASFKGEKIKQLVKLFKLTPVLDAKFIDVSANLSWPGQAHTLNLRQSYGKMKLNAQNVKLTKVSSGVGGVIGLMDIAGILNRISLDFKNLSSSKVSFDTVQGDWNIGGGRAMTRNAYAAGSLIDVKWVGAADLHRRVFDNIKITVIPKASNVIPVVGAVAGGVVGVVIGVVVQQVAGDRVNKAVGIPYRLSGKWLQPILTSGSDKAAKAEASQPAPATITLESIE